MQHRKLHLEGKVVNYFDVELREVNLPNEVKGIGKDFILFLFVPQRKRTRKKKQGGDGVKSKDNIWLMLLTAFCEVSVQMMMGIDAE